MLSEVFIYTMLFALLLMAVLLLTHIVALFHTPPTDGRVTHGSI
jgi:hypothetical protein